MTGFSVLVSPSTLRACTIARKKTLPERRFPQVLQNNESQATCVLQSMFFYMFLLFCGFHVILIVLYMILIGVHLIVVGFHIISMAFSFDFSCYDLECAHFYDSKCADFYVWANFPDVPFSLEIIMSSNSWVFTGEFFGCPVVSGYHHFSKYPGTPSCQC